MVSDLLEATVSDLTQPYISDTQRRNAHTFLRNCTVHEVPNNSLAISTQTGIILNFHLLYQRNCMASEGNGECLYKLIRLFEGTSTMKVVLLDCNVRVQAITAARARLELGSLENGNSSPDH